MQFKYINFGIDAPGVIRNLLIGAFVCFFITGLVWFLIPGPWAWWLIISFACVLLSGITYLIPAILMLFSSLMGKQIQAERLLNRIPWRGDEIVLDAGCGRGLLLIKAAQRLKMGKAVGVDIWNSEDLSGNSPEWAVINAQKAGVTDRIEIHDADIRNLPFQDATFDCIVSNLVIHNINQSDERKKAIDELIRVLKPGGILLIQDFQFTQEYADYCNERGLRNVKRSGLQWLIFPPVRLVSGRK